MSAAPPPSDNLASPCVRNCCLDDDNVCLGCGRSLDEIVAWSTADDDRETRDLEPQPMRAAARTGAPEASPGRVPRESREKL